MAQCLRPSDETYQREAEAGGVAEGRTKRGGGRHRRRRLWAVGLCLGLWPAPALPDPACILTTLLPTRSGAYYRALTMNASGTRIAFDSYLNLTGETPFYAPEIFLMHLPTRTLTLLTHNAGGLDCCPTLSAIGTRLAFNTHAGKTFVVDIPTHTLTQLTTTGWSSPPTLNASGTRIAFSNDSDLSGENPDRNWELFLVNTYTRTVTQLTHSTEGGSDSPTMNASGTRIAFVSTSDLSGENPDHNREIFFVDTRTRTLTQVTHSTGGDNDSPVINASGTHIAFVVNHESIVLARCPVLCSGAETE